MKEKKKKKDNQYKLNKAMAYVSNCSILPKNVCRYRQIREDEGNRFFSNADCVR